LSFTSEQGRRQLLAAVAEAVDELGVALAALGAAYEQLPERSADELEATLFGPVQAAYGRAQRAHGEFAARHGIESRSFASASPGAPSAGAKGFIDAAVAGVARADGVLVTLQDSMLPVEVGDPELRAALAQVRTQLSGFSQQAHEVVRTLGR
jgi:hypothetical protein